MYMGNELLSPHSQPPLSVGGIFNTAKGIPLFSFRFP